ncbi:MAG TPA: hypothetical protein VE781_11830 [Kineosporiaceae bacterium]|jgi:hypothetical protein|nr:hypothetical protein [Kineosporiaceae bacterium]
MTADSGIVGLSRGSGFGRGGVNSFADRREAARQRLTTTAHAAMVVDEALQTLDRRLAASGHLGAFERLDSDGALRASVRALLTVAHTTPGYDLTLTHLTGVRVRVRHAEHGLTVDVLGPALPRTATGHPAGTRGAVTTGAPVLVQDHDLF